MANVVSKCRVCSEFSTSILVAYGRDSDGSVYAMLRDRSYKKEGNCSGGAMHLQQRPQENDAVSKNPFR